MRDLAGRTDRRARPSEAHPATPRRAAMSDRAEPVRRRAPETRCRGDSVLGQWPTQSRAIRMQTVRTKRIARQGRGECCRHERTVLTVRFGAIPASLLLDHHLGVRPGTGELGIADPSDTDDLRRHGHRFSRPRGNRYARRGRSERLRGSAVLPRFPYWKAQLAERKNQQPPEKASQPIRSFIYGDEVGVARRGREASARVSLQAACDERGGALVAWTISSGSAQEKSSTRRL